MESKEGQLDNYIPVTRGLRVDRNFTGIDFKNIGTHWTTDPSVSREFARHANRHREEELGGVVVHGLVHKKHVLPTDHPDAKAGGILDDSVMPAESRESEVPIRVGAPVKVTKVAFHNGDHSHDLNMSTKRRGTKRARA